jgi:hypothetical protein
MGSGLGLDRLGKVYTTALIACVFTLGRFAFTDGMNAL